MGHLETLCPNGSWSAKKKVDPLVVPPPASASSVNPSTKPASAISQPAHPLHSVAPILSPPMDVDCPPSISTGSIILKPIPGLAGPVTKVVLASPSESFSTPGSKGVTSQAAPTTIISPSARPIVSSVSNEVPGCAALAQSGLTRMTSDPEIDIVPSAGPAISHIASAKAAIISAKVYDISVAPGSDHGLSPTAGRKDLVEFGQINTALDSCSSKPISHMVAVEANPPSRLPVFRVHKKC